MVFSHNCEHCFSQMSVKYNFKQNPTLVCQHVFLLNTLMCQHVFLLNTLMCQHAFLLNTLMGQHVFLLNALVCKYVMLLKHWCVSMWGYLPQCWCVSMWYCFNTGVSMWCCSNTGVSVCDAVPTLVCQHMMLLLHCCVSMWFCSNTGVSACDAILTLGVSIMMLLQHLESVYDATPTPVGRFIYICWWLSILIRWWCTSHQCHSDYESWSSSPRLSTHQLVRLWQ